MIKSRSCARAALPQQGLVARRAAPAVATEEHHRRRSAGPGMPVRSTIQSSDVSMPGTQHLDQIVIGKTPWRQVTTGASVIRE